jgi:hypothetical protein
MGEKRNVEIKQKIKTKIKKILYKDCQRFNILFKEKRSKISKSSNVIKLKRKEKIVIKETET